MQAGQCRAPVKVPSLPRMARTWEWAEWTRSRVPLSRHMITRPWRWRVAPQRPWRCLVAARMRRWKPNTAVKPCLPPRRVSTVRIAFCFILTHHIEWATPQFEFFSGGWLQQSSKSHISKINQFEGESQNFVLVCELLKCFHFFTYKI